MATKLTRALRTKRTAILAAIQPDYDTFVMPVAADYLQVRNVKLDPLSHSTIELNEVCSKLGSRLKNLSAQHVKLSFEAAFRGAVPTTLIPNIGKVLRMCGLGETTDATAKTAVYAPVDDNFAAGSVVVYIDGNKHAMMGCRGKVSARWPTNDYPTFSVELLGLYIDPVYEANPDTACVAPPNPLEVNNINTAWELHGITTALYSANVDIATNPTLLDLPGQNEIAIFDRACTGSIEFAASRISEKNWFQTVRDQLTGKLLITHGNTAGNIVECVANNVQLLEPNYGDQNQRRSNTFNLNIMPTSTAGEHEIAFIFR